MLPHPGLPPFDYVRARTPTEVCALLAEHGAAARLLLGGTDLLVRMRDGQVRPRLVVDVKHLPGMRALTPSPPSRGRGEGLTIGAAVTLNEVARHPAVRARYALLAQAAEQVASYPLRNRATLGGNLCNASPAADTAPAVLLLEGRMVLYGPVGEREIPASDFFLGPGKTAMVPGEFLTAVRFPPPPAGAIGRCLKLGRTRAGDLALVGVAVLGFPDDTARTGYRFRIGLAAVAPTPLRAHAAEAVLAAGPLTEETFARAAGEAMNASSPIDDVRASAAYRRAMVRNLTLRALRQVWEELEVGG